MVLLWYYGHVPWNNDGILEVYMYSMVFYTCTIVLLWYFGHLTWYYHSLLDMYHGITVVFWKYTMVFLTCTITVLLYFIPEFIFIFLDKH